MKKFTAKYLSLLMLASLLGGNAQASRDHYDNGGDCCPRQYECGCNPLYCGAWDLQIQAGVAPVIWRNRGPLFGINCANSTTSPVVTIFNTFPRFRKFFKIPWIVGGQIGYALSDNGRVYLEFDYTQANRKNAVAIVTDSTIPSVGTLTFTFDKFKAFEGYVGARYYWDRWCDALSFFLGGKIGFLRHKRQNFVLLAAFPSTAVATTFVTQPFNNRSTRVSGGANFGLDYCICGNWSLVLTGEVVATCGPRGVGPIHLTSTVGGFTDLITPSIGTELRFPVTLGVRYSF
jgi:hypothetical protein